MGFFRFVGELYLQKLLSSNIMNGCMRQLSTSDSENDLESLSKLILTIGREYEREFSQIQTVIYKPKESTFLFFCKCIIC